MILVFAAFASAIFENLVKYYHWAPFRNGIRPSWSRDTPTARDIAPLYSQSLPGCIPTPISISALNFIEISAPASSLWGLFPNGALFPPFALVYA
jgi:hypothetical protein